MRRRVVVTGLGAVTPVGIGVDAFWRGLLEGRSGVGYITRFDTTDFPVKIGAEVTDFDPLDFIDRKEARRMDRFCQFAVAAAELAVEDAGLDKYDPDRTGVVMGTGVGGMETLIQQLDVMKRRGPERVSPFFVPMMIANMAAGQIAIRFDARGPNSTVVTACAAATNAIGDAFRIIASGLADVMITGGAEAAFVPIAVAGFWTMRALSRRNGEPEKASRPFDAGRDGFVMGEGAGVLVLESLEHALARGAEIYGEVLGYGMAADAYHITAPAPRGAGGVRSMTWALEDAGLEPESVDYINAHGTSTPLNDRLETEAIKTVFGQHAYKLAVSSTKSVTGHLLGAAGAIEAMACLLAIRDGVVPPTINHDQPDEGCDLDYVPNVARRMKVRIALSNSFGFGGQNATLIFGQFAE